MKPALLKPYRGAQRPLPPVKINRFSPQADGLVSAWLFGDNLGNGQIITDLTGVNHATWNTASADTSAAAQLVVDRANYFDRTNNYATAGTTGLNTSSGTLAGWFSYTGSRANFNDWVAWSMIFSSGERLFMEVMTQALDFTPRFLFTYNTAAVYSYSTATISNDTWYHVVATWDTTDGLRLYQDGAEQSRTASSFSAPTLAGTQTIGGYNAGATIPFHGYMGEMRLYNRALSANEAYALFAPKTRWDLYESSRQRMWAGDFTSAPVAAFNPFFLAGD